MRIMLKDNKILQWLAMSAWKPYYRLAGLIGMSILVGVVYAFPNAVYPMMIGEKFNGIAFTNSMNEWAYNAYAREAAE